MLWQKGKWVGNPLAENMVNHARIGYPDEDGLNYWMDMIPGKTKQWIRVYLEGLWGTVSDGMPVYGDSFADHIHISEEVLAPIKKIDIILGWDFGLTPACIIGQVMPSGQVRIIQEICATDMGLRRVAENEVMPVLQQR